MFHSLESRTLFSAPLSLSNGVLTVRGGSGDEIVSIAKVSSKKINASITRSDGSVSQKTYNLSGIQRIRISAGDGNDQIHLSTLGKIKKGITVDAGGGDDLVMGPLTGKVSITGGKGRDNIIVSNVSASIDLRDGGKDFLTCDERSTVFSDKGDSVIR